MLFRSYYLSMMLALAKSKNGHFVPELKFMTIPGNHDILANNIESLPRTLFGMLEKVKLIQNVYAHSIMVKNEEGKTIEITGTANGHINTKAKYKKTTDFLVHVFHDMILTTPIFVDQDYIAVEEVFN